MKTELVQIGNSRGVRIPKAFLEQARLRDKIDKPFDTKRLHTVRGVGYVLR